MIFKKIVLIITLVFLISSCHEEPKLNNEKNKKKIVLGFSQVGSESDWRIANTESIILAAKKNNIQLKFEDAQQKQENQIKHLRSFIAHNVDVIAFSPIVVEGWDSVLTEAKKAGIPVILIDRGIETNIASLYSVLIGADFLEEGKKAGSWVINDLEYEENNVNIVEIKGTIGSSSTIERSIGFESVINNNSKIKIVKSEYGDFLRSKGKEVMKDILMTQKDIDVLFSHNDDMALGAVEAIEEFGLKPGKDIKIVSVDGNKEALKAIMDKKLNCSVESNPYIGEKLMETINNIFKGNKIDKRILIEGKIFTKENANKEYLNRSY